MLLCVLGLTNGKLSGVAVAGWGVGITNWGGDGKRLLCVLWSVLQSRSEVLSTWPWNACRVNSRYLKNVVWKKKQLIFSQHSWTDDFINFIIHHSNNKRFQACTSLFSVPWKHVCLNFIVFSHIEACFFPNCSVCIIKLVKVFSHFACVLSTCLCFHTLQRTQLSVAAHLG